MLDLNTLHQINTDKEAYKQFRESRDRAAGHELETKNPEWFLVNYIGSNLIPGTEAPSVTEFKAVVVIPNEYGCFLKPEAISSDHWLEMADAESDASMKYDRVSVVSVFNNDGKLIHEPAEVET